MHYLLYKKNKSRQDPYRQEKYLVSICISGDQECGQIIFGAYTPDIGMGEFLQSSRQQMQRDNIIYSIIYNALISDFQYYYEKDLDLGELCTFPLRPTSFQLFCCSLFCEGSSVSLVTLISYVSLQHARREKSPALVHFEKKKKRQGSSQFAAPPPPQKGYCLFSACKGAPKNARIPQGSTLPTPLQICSHRQTQFKKTRQKQKMKCFKHHPQDGHSCICLPSTAMQTQVLTTACVGLD